MVGFLIFLLRSLSVVRELLIHLQQPQGDYIQLHRKRYGYRFDHFERLYVKS